MVGKEFMVTLNAMAGCLFDVAVSSCAVPLLEGGRKMKENDCCNGFYVCVSFFFLFFFFFLLTFFLSLKSIPTFLFQWIRLSRNYGW
jgi:hypothetical protein